MADIAALKKRLILFGVLDGLAILVAIVGFVGDLAYGVDAFKPVWIVGLLAAVAAQTWLVLGMRAGKDK